MHRLEPVQEQYAVAPQTVGSHRKYPYRVYSNGGTWEFALESKTGVATATHALATKLVARALCTEGLKSGGPSLRAVVKPPPTP